MIAPLLSVAMIAVYLWAVRRYRELYPARGFEAWRVLAFVCGALCFGAALCAPADALADRSFAAHMVQHVVLMLVAPPLVLLGAPLLLAVAVPRRDLARTVAGVASHPVMHALFAPIVGWVLFVGVLWGVHFSPLYEGALELRWVHVVEHVVFITAAFLFWLPVVQVGFVPRPVSFPARMLYLVLMFPQGAFLGLAIYGSRHVLYPHYGSVLGSAAMTDQQNGGAVMWIAGGFIMFAAFMLVAASWARSERHAIA
ncbi:MAG TPA: cytochrome c oxidase assembly protein [Candidatus Rubrimentiphilum sp.]|nr:cytochrome c oxidase assembly protein [Candidatus Rubrimentiphilum sp.]